MSQVRYFKYEEFVNDVLDALKVQDKTSESAEELKLGIVMRLSQRVMDTVIDSFMDKELDMFERILLDHQEIDELDAIMMIAPQIPGLKERIEREIQSLYEELIYDAQEIDRLLSTR